MAECPHFDLTSPETFVGGMPRETFAWLRREQPVYWHEEPNGGRGFWAVTRQADIDYISKNPQIFSSEVETCFLHEHDDETLPMMQLQMINMDPPKHLKFRRLIRNAFTPRAVDAYEQRFREVARDILDRACSDNHCEFVEDVAAELPLIAICELMGVPLEQRTRLFELTNIMLGMDDPELATTEEEGMMAMIEMFGIAQGVAAAQKENPHDDIVRTLLSGTIEDEPLTEEQFCHFFMLLIVAGNETTRTVTSHGMRLLIESGQYAVLQQDPSLLEGAVEEFLRYNPAVIAFRRTALEDAEVGGQKVLKGQKVHMFYGAANADESVFSDPDTFDITRASREDVRNSHRAFGVGQHFCLGSHLARLELRVIFQEILNRIYEPAFDGEINWLRSSFINGIKKMPIRFTTKPSEQRQAS